MIADKIKCGLVLVALTASMGVFAKEKPFQYIEKNSRAWNIWSAAGMGNDLQDQVVPSDKIGDFLDTKTGKVIDTASNINTLKLGGVGGGTATGLGLLSFALDALGPEKQPMRNSFWYWMKDTGQTAEEARDELAKRLLVAARKVIIGNEFTTDSESDPIEWHLNVIAKANLAVSLVSIFSGGTSEGCSQVPWINDGSFSNCQFKSVVYTPKKVKFDFDGTEGNYWFFSASDKVIFNNINFIFIAKQGAPSKKMPSYLFNELIILDGISKEIGDGFYIYIAPNTTYVSPDKKVPYPMLIEKGEHLLFVRAK